MLYLVSVKFGSDGRVIVNGNEITISISSEPKRGRANAEVVKKLALHFEVEPSSIRIVRGMAARKKLIEISERA